MRLPETRQFERVFAGRNALARTALFTVLGLANDLGLPRLGLAVSRKRVRRASAPKPAQTHRARELS